MVKIITFTGLAMTGKSTACKLLQQLLHAADKHYRHIHLGSTEEVARRDKAGEWSDSEAGLSQPEKEKLVRENWRQQKGLGVMIDKFLPKVSEAVAQNSLVTIDNLMSYEELQELEKHFGRGSVLVVTMACDWSVRVRRGQQRKERPMTAAELAARDKAEVITLNKGAMIALADVTIVNNFNEKQAEQSRANLEKELSERVLSRLN